MSPSEVSRVPFRRDPAPVMAKLVRFLDDSYPPSDVSRLAIALRAALGTCAEQQELALAGLADPEPGERGARYRWRDLATLEMANRVVRAIGEQVDELEERR